MPSAALPADLLKFLRELAAHNERPWFLENKARYLQTVQAPMLAFLEAFKPRLARLSKQFVVEVRPSGGSLMRIYRDVRFSKDKSPYRTHLGASFSHRASDEMGGPGWYLHIQPGASFIAAGAYHPESASLARLRDALVRNPSAWRRVVGERGFRAVATLSGDRLKRPPRGFAPDHPLIEDLKRKDFICVIDLSDREVTAPDFLARLTKACAIQAPFLAFVCKALRLPF